MSKALVRHNIIPQFEQSDIQQQTSSPMCFLLTTSYLRRLRGLKIVPVSGELAPAEDDWAEYLSSRLHRGHLQNKQTNKQGPAAWRNPNLPLERASEGASGPSGCRQIEQRPVGAVWLTSLSHVCDQRLRRDVTRSRRDLTTFFSIFEFGLLSIGASKSNTWLLLTIPLMRENASC